MSVRAMGWVWEMQGLSPAEKLVALAYADHAGHDGEGIYPAVRTVARKTGYSRRTVQATTRRLVERGLLEEVGQGPGGTNEWRLVEAPGGGAESAPGVQELHGGGAGAARGGVQNLHGGGAGAAPKPSVNRKEEPSFNLFPEEPPGDPGGWQPQMHIPEDQDSRQLRSNLQELPLVPEALLSRESWAAWCRWLDYRRKEKKTRVTKGSAELVFRDSLRCEIGPGGLVEALETSEAGGWLSVHPHKVKAAGGRFAPPAPVRTSSERSRMVDMDALEDPQ